MREPRPSSSHTTAWRATSDSTAGENSAAAKPITSTAPITAQLASAYPSQANPAIRSTQPASTTGRTPNRSTSQPPTTNSPCWLKVRSPSTKPTSQPAMPIAVPRCSARNGRTA